MNILLIDDDTDHLLLCKCVLQKNGFKVTTLSQPELVMTVIKASRPDLIFVDHSMKEVTGIDVTKMIKSRPESVKIPVIYFSSSEDIVQLSKEAGADDYLSKPLEFHKLVETARKYFHLL